MEIMGTILDRGPLVLHACFFSVLMGVIVGIPGLFLRRYGRRHRIMGLIYLTWLVIGFLSLPAVLPQPLVQPVVYDSMLGIFGLALTLSAAYDFGSAHRNVTNVASGALDNAATVTVSEMIEHSFYQMLNLVQILYLHSLQYFEKTNLCVRLALALLASAPWAVRRRFPVNSFSDNYTKGQSPWTVVSVLYRIKKYQYLLYKHCLLHGLNLGVAVQGGHSIFLATTPYFRLYWLSLNTAYVMEFFLQSLVKRNHMRQGTMLMMNTTLMVASTVPALLVIMRHVDLPLAMLSLGLNLGNRGHDLENVAITGVLGSVVWLIRTR
mmetsp:Transcript_21636/g.41334  ORF Transcript_21636/g.41334 Transcript_21636/m.41334 type:complete len:322 (+) Transcript_21636:243-1208(+)